MNELTKEQQAIVDADKAELRKIHNVDELGYSFNVDNFDRIKELAEAIRNVELINRLEELEDEIRPGPRSLRKLLKEMRLRKKAEQLELLKQNSLSAYFKKHSK